MRIPLAAKAQPANGAIELVIEHIVTADMADGQPLPPLIEDNIVWHLVRRADGYTIWRRLHLSTSPVTDWRTAPGDQRERCALYRLQCEVGSEACESFSITLGQSRKTDLQ